MKRLVCLLLGHGDADGDIRFHGESFTFRCARCRGSVRERWVDCSQPSYRRAAAITLGLALCMAVFAFVLIEAGVQP